MENVGIYYDHSEYFTAIWYNLWPFGIVCVHLVHFFQFGMLGPRKIWQPWTTPFQSQTVSAKSGYLNDGTLIRIETVA
jgi:hypothetical protein